MPAETFTAPLAIIKINNQSVGKIKQLSFTENIQRGEVIGLGELTLQEAPAVAIRCQFQAGAYMINLKKLGTIKDPFWPVDALDAKTLLNTILLGETPVTIHVYRKTAGAIDANGIVTSEGAMERIGIISDCYVNSRSWEISEGNLAGKQISGIYFTPIFLI